MLGKPRILSLFPNLINSIKHEHSCKILYVLNSDNHIQFNKCTVCITSKSFIENSVNPIQNHDPHCFST